jgi:predicted O-methyltransferase YrrM
MNTLLLIWRYIKYLFTAESKHGLHSPFVFDLHTKVISSKKIDRNCLKIEKLRKELCLSEDVVEITDLGAGSTINNTKKRLVKDIAKNSAKSAKFGQLLYRLIQHFEPKNIVELGTSLGISANYLGGANSNGKVYTLEGCPNTAEKAKENIKSLGFDNIEVIVGDFKDTLTPTLNKIKKLDFGFLDGNHQKQPTIDYFEECLKYIDKNSVLVFDDIHWSTGMEEAWEHIKNHPKVFVSIDLFFVGLVFFNDTQRKEHFKIRF